MPSASLRDHLGTAWLKARGRASAGLAFTTLFAVALTVLERAGEPAPRGAPLLELLVRRLARRRPGLEAALGPFADGFGALAGAVRDLLDAGLGPAHREAVEELLATRARFGDLPRGLAARAREIVELAAACGAELERLGAGTTSESMPGQRRGTAAEPAAASAGPAGVQLRVPPPSPSTCSSSCCASRAASSSSTCLRTRSARAG
ncbi:MAG: hypothetical protein U0002_08700 [Thermoanaerobaculia bacterium]